MDSGIPDRSFQAFASPPIVGSIVKANGIVPKLRDSRADGLTLRALSRGRSSLISQGGGAEISALCPAKCQGAHGRFGTMPFVLASFIIRLASHRSSACPSSPSSSLLVPSSRPPFAVGHRHGTGGRPSPLPITLLLCLLTAKLASFVEANSRLETDKSLWESKLHRAYLASF
jgi:hypothetical protein